MNFATYLVPYCNTDHTPIPITLMQAVSKFIVLTGITLDLQQCYLRFTPL